MDGFGAFVPGPRTRLAPTASGPLDGLTFVAKDLIDVAGTITGGGNPDWRAQQEPIRKSASVVERFLNAGATLVGKTITDELAFSLLCGYRVDPADERGTAALARACDLHHHAVDLR